MTHTEMMPSAVDIREVGPRDGLQPEEPVDVAERVELIESLLVAGVSRIEITAFVSPKAVPSMAGAAQVVAAVAAHEGLTRAALVPNARGAEMAVDAGVDEITVTISASETYNLRNVNMTLAQSEAEIASIVEIAGALPVDAVISCAFGSPYEGEIEPGDIAALIQRLTDAGVTRSTCADTTGMATPRRVDDVIDAWSAAGVSTRDMGLHLHDTRGTALVNAYAAMQRGVARFDTAVGGVGGSPFAHGAGGNLATESLVALLDDLGIESGIDIDLLLEATRVMETLIGRPLPSGVANHGPRSRLANS